MHVSGVRRRRTLIARSGWILVYSVRAARAERRRGHRPRWRRRRRHSHRGVTRARPIARRVRSRARRRARDARRRRRRSKQSSRDDAAVASLIVLIRPPSARRDRSFARLRTRARAPRAVVAATRSGVGARAVVVRRAYASAWPSTRSVRKKASTTSSAPQRAATSENGRAATAPSRATYAIARAAMRGRVVRSRASSSLISAK